MSVENPASSHDTGEKGSVCWLVTKFWCTWIGRLTEHLPLPYVTYNTLSCPFLILHKHILSKAPNKSHTFLCPDVSADLNETLECVDPFMFMAPLNH